MIGTRSGLKTKLTFSVQDDLYLLVQKTNIGVCSHFCMVHDWSVILSPSRFRRIIALYYFRVGLQVYPTCGDDPI